MIGPAQRPLPDNTQHSQEKDGHAPVGFETAIPASERPQTQALGPRGYWDRLNQYKSIQNYVSAIYQFRISVNYRMWGMRYLVVSTVSLVNTLLAAGHEVNALLFAQSLPGVWLLYRLIYKFMRLAISKKS